MNRWELVAFNYYRIYLLRGYGFLKIYTMDLAKGLVVLVLCSVVGAISLVDLGEFMLPIRWDVTRVRTENDIKFQDENSYAVLDFIGLVERHGYTAEEHEVTTRDGYILALHRITGSQSSPKAPGKPIVYFQHGLLLSSDSFVLIGPGRDLAFLLADAGYDVWFGNARGNTYSRKHVYLSPEHKDFWQFSYHEIGLFDVRATIDFILQETRQDDLVYLGYSMGSTEILVLLSTLPEYNEKISLVVHLAPVVFWNNMDKVKVFFLQDIAILMKDVFEKFQIYEVLPQSSFVGKLGKTVCHEPSVLVHSICQTMIEAIVPFIDVPRCNQTAMSEIMSYFPAGTSLQAILHYYQNMISGRFEAFDFGRDLNLWKYGRPQPPVYKLKNVTAPVAIFYGAKDFFADPKDQILLQKMLPNVVYFHQIRHPNFNHLDFLWSVDVNLLLYKRVRAVIDKHRAYYYHVWQNKIPSYT